MVAEVKNQQKLTRANSLKEKKTTKASLDHAAARVVKIMNKNRHYIMVAEVKNQQKLTRANSLKKKKEKNTKASLDHAAARVVKNRQA